MTRKQIIACTILAFIFAPMPSPDIITKLVFAIPTALMTCMALLLVGRSELIKSTNLKVRRVISVLISTVIVLGVHVAHLRMVFHAIK